MSKNSRTATAVAERTAVERATADGDPTAPDAVAEDAVADGAVAEEGSGSDASSDGSVEVKDPVDEKVPGVTAKRGEPNGNENETDSGSGDSVDRRRILLVTVGLVAVVAIAVAVVFGWKLAQANAVDDASAAALDAARSYAVVLTSVSSDDLDSNFAAVLDGATGEFKDMYAQSSEQLRQLLVDNNATAEGVVIDAGIKSATATEVEVLLFVDQTVTNTVSPEPRLDRSRVVMTMELVDGRWLASDVTLP